MDDTETPVVIAGEAGEVFANSRDVAAYFGKLHKNVMRDIRALVLSEPRTGLSFELSEYVDASGKSNPTFDMTRDGFTLLAMGFTGKRAVKFKLAYIEAFNRMEEELRRKGPNLPDFSDPVGSRECAGFSADPHFLPATRGRQSEKVQSGRSSRCVDRHKM